MMFDILAKTVEKHFPELIDLVDRSQLFIIETDYDFSQVNIEEKEIHNFFLPFKTVAIEDLESIIILEDTENKQKSLYTKRKFLECQCIFKPFFPVFKIGTIEGTNEKLLITLERGIVLKENKKIDMLEHPMTKMMTPDFVRDATQNVSIALKEIIYLNNLENRFILEEKPINPKIKKDMIARSHQRSKFTILEPKTIRKRLGLKATGKALTEGYERRRHKRTYKDERYIHMKGKTVLIDATWVGPSEVKKKKRIYKVRLDL